MATDLVTLTIPYKSVFSIPVTLKRDGATITFSGTLLFMVKKNETDDDSAAIISKTLTIANTNGSPYHALLSLTLTDTSKTPGIYSYGFKTGESGVWLPTETGKCEITEVVVQGQTA